MIRILARLSADAMFVATCTFGAAGTFAWPRAWILLSVLLVVRITTAVAVYRISPALVLDRAKLPIHGDQPPADRVLLLAVLATGFLGLPAIAAADAFHWHLLARPSEPVAVSGLVL